MNLPYSEKLDIKHLSRLFDNMSECYKIFWFRAILESVIAGNQEVTFDELINNMIADAWYMVSEYKLNLGPKDNLEQLILSVSETTGLKSCEKRSKIITALRKSNDPILREKKTILTYNVPYRLQAPFMPSLKGDAWNVSKSRLAERINSEGGLMYRFKSIEGINSVIEIDDDWFEYLTTNREIISGWVYYNLISYLQKRNPSVPGISSKLYPPQERNLTKVKNYWKAIINVQPVHDIYGDTLITDKDISIDHFIPWSYVAHDELWNLSPTTRSINSSKSNNLPDWNEYFKRLCDLEFLAYETVWKYEKVHKEFDKCLNEHVNNSDIRMKLYIPNISRIEFSNRLEEIMTPIYTAAKNMGFENWKLV